MAGKVLHRLRGSAGVAPAVAARRSESVTAATDSSAVVDESPVATGLRTGR